MKRVLDGLEPREVFYWFEEISRIPHGTFHERELSDYLKRFAQERNFPVKQDESWNLAIEVPATPGYENRPKMILQAHIDMVCKKDDGYAFDFEKDPLSLYVDGDWVRAEHTTLGADNGSGVAMILAVMDSKTVKHPPLQVLFTTIEEVACTGAGAMADDWPDGDRIINLDVFRDDALMVSCAGISIHDIRLAVKREAIADPKKKRAFHIEICGLRGGHSGESIHEGRANGAAVLGELLAELDEKASFSLVSASADGLFNVICSRSEAVICLESEAAEAGAAVLAEIGRCIREAYARTDPDMEIRIDSVKLADDSTAIAEETKKSLIRLLYLAPSGMQTIFDDPCTQAGSSSNFGSLEEKDGEFWLVMSIRSNTEYRHDEILRKYRLLCEDQGARLVTNRRIGSWEYTPYSPLRNTAARIYEEQNGEPPQIIVIHAGVEVATILAKLEKQGRTADAIAFGCNTPGAHSTGEAWQISSAAKAYRLLTAILEQAD
jgi:dipeptidase D